MTDSLSTISFASLIAPTARFQRAVHLRYDLRDQDTIERYIPTSSAVDALEAILRGVHPNGTQRAHVLHAAYGSGKSVFAVSLAALLEKSSSLLKSLERLVMRIAETRDDVGTLAKNYVEADARLFPVVLSGDEGDLSTALTRALARALKDSPDTRLTDMKPPTRFNTALQTIEQWENDYPDTLSAFNKIVNSKRLKPSKLKQLLSEGDSEAFTTFENAYIQLTGGAAFDRFSQMSPELVYRDTAAGLREFGYSGIAILWDEFGRYLDARTSQAFGTEAALLQTFAETCNHSGDQQLHLILFAHKELQSYASTLPKSYQLEWSRIEGRFQKHNVTGEASIAYRLIASAIQHVDNEAIADLLDRADAAHLVAQTVDAQILDPLPSDSVRETIRSTWPLHPLTTYSLTRLSNKVAQNERTMFTFLTVNEPFSLLNQLETMNVSDEDFFVRPAVLWDYFSDVIRADVGVGGAHRVWLGTIHALDKIRYDDVLGNVIVKTIGVLTICADQSVGKPSTDMICWAVGAVSEEQQAAVIATLENLRRRKVIINRKTDGYWTFTSGSDIDFEQKLAEILQRVQPTHVQLRRMLEQTQPAPYTVARRYNQDRAITRFFNGLYRWPEEIADAPWDLQIAQLDNADGLVIYVLAIDELGLADAKANFAAHERVVYVLPQKPLLSLGDVLRELYGLHELNNDPELKQEEDRSRIQRELDWLLEDAETRLERELSALVNPRNSRSIWVSSIGTSFFQTMVANSGQSTRLVSEICERVFDATPIFNSEGLNKRYPTGQQTNAAQKVIDALLTREASATLGLEGFGPEVAALNSLIALPKILCQTPEGNWIVSRPVENSLLSALWDHIEDYLRLCREDGKQSIALLLQTLIAPPFGLRQGVIPILFAAVLRSHVRATTIRHNDHAVHPINGELLTRMVAKPDEYTIEMGEWSEVQERLWQALQSRFSAHIHDNERYQPPLTILKISMLRWLQGLPNFCRDTQQISKESVRFRNLIRSAQTDPGKVLFKELPELLQVDEQTSQQEIESRLEKLISEISNAYLELQRRLDWFSIKEFGSGQAFVDGARALRSWVNQLQSEQNTSVSEMRYGSLITQQVVETVLRADSSDSQFWDKLSNATTGLHLRDWNDQSEAKFYQTLLTTRTQVERETEELLRGETVVSVSLQLPKTGQKEFRFRASDLTVQGKRILQNFKSTLEISGRPLTADEKRQIVVAFLCHVMGEDIDG
jgi:hypothetical protein